MSDGSYSEQVVPVRVVDPIPDRGRNEVTRTQVGPAKMIRGNNPTLLLPERFTRTLGRIYNGHATETLYVGSSESVAPFTGAPIPPGKDLIWQGSNPAWGVLDPTVGALGDVLTAAIVDTYLVPWAESSNGDSKRNR